MKIDVAVQSYKKPESLIYTLLSLKKHCGDLIDTIYINDDCSNDGTVELYDNQLKKAMDPIKLKIRINDKASGYNTTLMTIEAFKKKSLLEKTRLLMYFPIKRISFHKNDDDIRYQWALNNTDKDYLFLIHDDIKFFDNVLKLYLETINSDNKMAIVGDLGYCRVCPHGPCGVSCSPEKILRGEYPDKLWPITGCDSVIHKIMGRYRRNCRINEWCCLINVSVSKKIVNEKGIYFGNYEAGGDVGTYWLQEIINQGYKFTDPLPVPKDRLKYYLHWWQGHEGHEVWVDYGRGKQSYQKDYIKKCLETEFGYTIS